jgi:cell division protease FtsH
MAKSKSTTTTIPERDLPVDLTAEQAVEAAYSDVLAEVASKLRRGLPVLVEADKDLAPFLYMNVRTRLKACGLQALYLDGRPRAQDAAALNLGFVGSMLAALRDAVRGAIDRRVVVLPHLDLLTTSQGGLTSEAREVIPLLYENPELVWLGFKDPSFPLPRVIENLFPHRASLLGIPRDRLGHLVTQKESRKFGQDFNPWALYKYVSGVNAVRLRRLLSTLEGEDYPNDPKHAYRQLRQATLTGTLELPEIDLDREIGGYSRVKKRLKAEILDVLAHKEHAGSAEEVARLEELIPRGMIFWGPPGTGKTLFAKAMAASLGAAVTVVSGPELKSRWVGESEDNLRQVFRKARQSAPSIIIFDELDSFASARGMYNGSGVEHSMVNQLLTEMDGFHRDEMVFVVGTTNFVEALDPALLRPGRFEFHLHIPYPEADDRREILAIYNKSMRLEMSPDAIEAAIRATAGQVEGAVEGTRHSGDHINALCRTIARIRLREEIRRETTPEDVDRAINEWIELPKMTPAERKAVATNEAGHAICSINCPHSPPIERISIRGDISGSLGFVSYQDKAHRYVVTRNELIDRLCVLMGGREAESLLLDDLSIGSFDDLNRATKIARALVEDFGMGGVEIGVCRFGSDDDKGRLPYLSEDQRRLLDRRIGEILEEARTRAGAILSENRTMVDAKTLKMLSKADEPEVKHG